VTADELTLDFTSITAPKKRKRSQRDIEQYWWTRHDTFLRAGFTEEEARWGASNGLTVRDKRVQRLIKVRKAKIRLAMKAGYTRDESIEKAAQDLRDKLDFNGISELNLFYEVSP